jgi:hypothetical protein
VVKINKVKEGSKMEILAKELQSKIKQFQKKIDEIRIYL